MPRVDRRVSGRRFGAIVCAMALIAASCSGSVSVGDGDGGSSSSSDSSILTLLRWVPDPAGSLEQLIATDFDRASAALSIERPDECPAGDPALERYRDGLFIEGRDASVQAPQIVTEALVAPESLEVSFGIQLCEISAALEGGIGTLVMRVDSAADDIDRAVRADSVWAEFLSTEQTGGQTFYDWGDELLQAPPSPVRRLGEGGQLAVIDDVVVRTREREVLEAHLAASAGRSMLDRRHVAAVVVALEDRGAYSLFLTELATTSGPTGLLGDAPEGLAEALDLDGDAGLLRWQLLGLGAALDDAGEPIVVVAMAHTTALDATENLDRFRATVENALSFSTNVPWSDLVTIEDLSADSELLTATLRGVDQPGFNVALRAIFTGDTLFQVAG